jgi:hypothetical protein
MSSHDTAALASLLLLWSSLRRACQFPYQTRDWSKYEGPGKEYFA